METCALNEHSGDNTCWSVQNIGCTVAGIEQWHRMVEKVEIS